MARIAASKKSIRQTKTRAEGNKVVRRRVKSWVNRTKKLIAAGDKVLAQEAYQSTTKTIDKAAKKNVISKNKAANQKSKLAKQLNQVKTKKAKSA